MAIDSHLIDAVTRHQVFLQRYAGGQSRDAVKLLNKLRLDINARLLQHPTNIQAAHLTAIKRDLDILYAESFGAITQTVTMGSVNMAGSESRFTAKLMQGSITVDWDLPSERSLLNAVANNPMVPRGGALSINLNDALDQFGKTKSAQINQVILDGVTLGDTTPVITKKVSELIKVKQSRELTTLVKTATNHASAVAREESYAENKDVLEGYEWVATLDNKTTLVCGGRDGVVYPIGRGPLPPAHWNCRSTTIPKVKTKYSKGSELQGDRPSVGSKGVEKVGANRTYGGWLKTQPKGFIDEALGPERSKLFRAGKIKIDGFTDPTGRVYTLKQLQTVDMMEFN